MRCDRSQVGRIDEAAIFFLEQKNKGQHELFVRGQTEGWMAGRVRYGLKQSVVLASNHLQSHKFRSE